MTLQLVNYTELAPALHEPLRRIELLPAQRQFAGDIEGALYTLLSTPGECICGLVLLLDGQPQGFMLLRRGALLPPWAQADAATLHSLQIDRRVQQRGLGRFCLGALPAQVRQLWPQVRRLQLSVDADNQTALGLYQAQGWRDSGEGFRARVGFERQLTFML